MAHQMYVSLQGDHRVRRFAFDELTGGLQQVGDVEISGGPAPLALDPKHRYLYVGRRDDHLMSSFEIDRTSGDLTLSSTVELQGEPCFISTDRTGRYLLSAYYQAGRCAVHEIREDGTIADAVEWRETATGAHCFQTDPTNRFAFLPHIAGRGPNAIYQYRFDERGGKLTPNEPAVLTPEREDGPRHYCFHPRLNIVYFSNEQGSSVTVYQLEAAGTLTPMQTVPTLPPGFDGQNSCSQIQITPSGRHLFAPNRGHNSIASFAVDEATGLLAPTGHVPAEAVPRAFTVDPTGRFVFAAGLESGRLAAYSIDEETGALDALQTYSLGDRPMWVLLASLD